MFIKLEAVMSEVFNIAKAYKNSGPQKKFSISRYLVYQLTLFRGSTVYSKMIEIHIICTFLIFLSA